ncbi:MAG TPA: YfhO family protein [Polyangiaceae bacterium]
MPRTLREILLPVGLGSLCILVFFVVFLPPTLRDLGTASRSANFDFQSYFLPKYLFGTEELLRGRLPAWNIYEYGGIPFIATMQPAAFYPPKVLCYALLPGVAAHWAFLIFHYFLGLLGFGLFCRELGLRREAAFIGGVAFLFSIPTLSGNYHPTRLACVAWIPFIFLIATRILRGGGLGAFAALSACVGLQLHAGYPEYTLDTGVFVAVYVLATWLAELPKRPRWSAPLIIGAAFLLGALTAAIDLLPLLEASVESRRSAAVANLLTTGNTTLPSALVMLYTFSIPGLVAFSVLSVATRRGWPVFLTLLFAVLLLSAASGLLSLLPWFRLIRFPYVLIQIALFFPAWAAALGADAFLSATDAPRGRKFLLVVCVILGALALIALYAGRLAGRWRHPGLPYDRVSTVLAIVGLVLVLASALALVKRLPAGALLVGGGLVLVLSQFAAYPFHLSPAPFARPAKEGEVKRLLGARPPPQGRAFSMHDILHGYNLTDRIPSVLGVEESFLPARFQKIRLRLRLTHILGFIDVAMFAGMRGFLDAMNLEYLAVKPRDVPLLEGFGFVPIALDRSAVLFHNPERMGPAWVNYSVRQLPSEDAAYEYIVGKHFDPHIEVVVSERLQRAYPARAVHLATPARSVRRPSPTELEVDVELPRPGVLVVSEAAYPGWTASVNGNPVPWLHANYVLRGVELGPGVHRVRFEYRPPALRWGTRITCVALLAVAACGLIGRTRRRF